MKVVILGDTHFGGGYSLGKIDSHRQLNTRLIDFSNTFNYVVDYMIDNGVRHFIITGDVFEYRRPQASELSLFSEKIYRLSELGIHTHIVIGNHDLIQEQRATTIDVLRRLKLPKVHVYADIDSVACDDGDTSDIINFIFFPFRTKRMLDCKTNDEAVNRLSDRLRYEIRGISKGPKILVGHFMLQGTMLGNTVLEGHGGEVVLPQSMFKGLDAVVMGHIHPHQIVKKSGPLITYVGSMERKDFGDAKDHKYFLLVETCNEDIAFKFEKLPVRPVYDITIDQSLVKESVTNGCIRFLRDHAKRNEMLGAIVRINIFINEKSLYDLDKDMIRAFLKKLNVHNCVNIHTQVVTKRQLRKSTITERIDPLKSFIEYLDLVEDRQMREQMRQVGSKIIKERRVT